MSANTLGAKVAIATSAKPIFRIECWPLLCENAIAMKMGWWAVPTYPCEHADLIHSLSLYPGSLCLLLARRRIPSGSVQQLLGGNVMNLAPGTFLLLRLLRPTSRSEHPFHRNLRGQLIQQVGHLLCRAVVQELPLRGWYRDHHPWVDFSHIIDHGIGRQFADHLVAMDHTQVSLQDRQRISRKN